MKVHTALSLLALISAAPLHAQAPQTPPTNPASGPAAARTAASRPEVQNPAVRPATQAPAAQPAATRGARPAAGTARTQMHSLSATRKVFADSDVDKDGVISEREATTIGVSKPQFRAFDNDGDGKITSDEFVVGYRQLVAEAGQAAAPDLEAEATRLQSLRRAQAAETERMRQGRSGAASESGSPERRMAAAGATPERVRAANAANGAGQTSETGRVPERAGATERPVGDRAAGERPVGERPAADTRDRATTPSRPTPPPAVRPAPQPRPQPAPRPSAPRPAPRPSGQGGRG